MPGCHFIFLPGVRLDQPHEERRLARRQRLGEAPGAEPPAGGDERDRGRDRAPGREPGQEPGQDGEKAEEVGAEERSRLGDRRLDPGIADEAPGEAGEDPRAGIVREGPDRGEEEDAREARPPAGPRQREGDGPEEREAAGHAHEREGGHPAVDLGLDEEGIDDPEERRGEVAGAGRPADREGGAGARGAVDEPEEDRQGEEEHLRPGDGRLRQRHRRATGGRERQARPCAERPYPALESDHLFSGFRRRPLGGGEAHPHAVDPARVGVHHLEFGAFRVQHHLAPRRHPAGEADDEAAEGVDLLGELGRRQPHAGRPLEGVEVHAGLGEVDARRLLGPELALGLVVLVGDVAADLLERLLDGDSPSTPPYSSMTSAMWMRAACIFCSSTQIGTHQITSYPRALATDIYRLVCLSFERSRYSFVFVGQ